MSDAPDLHVEQVLGDARSGGSCALCGSDYRGAPYSEGRGVRALATVESGVTEVLNLCPECSPGYVERTVAFSDVEIERLRPLAAYNDLTLDEAASLAVGAGFRRVAAEQDVDSLEDADPEKMVRKAVDRGLTEYIDGEGGDDHV